jgi:hypothetical protein
VKLTFAAKLENKPFVSLFEDRPYYAHDKYEDYHPIFNVSTIAALKVEISNDDFEHLLNVDNAFNQTYAKATVWYFIISS